MLKYLVLNSNNQTVKLFFTLKKTISKYRTKIS